MFEGTKQVLATCPNVIVGTLMAHCFICTKLVNTPCLDIYI